MDRTTTRSADETSPRSTSFTSAATAAAAAGSANSPAVLPKSGIASRISPSDTVTAMPPEARRSCTAMAPLRGNATLMLSARVSSVTGLMVPSPSKACLMACEPSAWAATSRGRRGIHPSR